MKLSKIYGKLINAGRYIFQKYHAMSKNYIVLTLACILSIMSIQAQHKKSSIKLQDSYGNVIGFFLLGNKSTVLRSNTDGVLEISKYQVRKYKNETFKLHFTNHLSYMLYKTNLYYKKGLKTSDKHLKSTQITLVQFVEQKNYTFYLRRKEIRLNDDGFVDIDSSMNVLNE